MLQTFQIFYDPNPYEDQSSYFISLCVNGIETAIIDIEADNVMLSRLKDRGVLIITLEE